MIITIETDIVTAAATDVPNKFLRLFADLDTLVTQLDKVRAEYLLDALLERFEPEPVIEVTLENITLAMSA